MTKDIIAEISRIADQMGLDEIEVAADVIVRLQSQISKLLTKLQHISLASQNSMSSKEECGRIARSIVMNNPDILNMHEPALNSLPEGRSLKDIASDHYHRQWQKAEARNAQLTAALKRAMDHLEGADLLIDLQVILECSDDIH